MKLMKLTPYAVACLATLLFSAGVSAEETAPSYMTPTTKSPYYGAQFGWVSPDGGRAQKNGPQLQFLYGIPLRQGVNLELNTLFRSQKQQTTNGGTGATDSIGGVGADLQLFQTNTEYATYLIGGVGVNYENLGGGLEKAIAPFVNGGIGLERFFAGTPWAIRGEGRAYYIRNEKSYFEQVGLVDYVFNVGVLYGFGVLPPPPVVEAPTPPVVVDGDEDKDGIIDSKDQCPGTTAGVNVDATGCPIAVVDGDADQDGVKDSVDACPGSAAGVTVDAKGCEVKVDGDGDKDGVKDSLDACPDTSAGFKVNDKGCLIEQTLTLRNVNFESGSDNLTAAAKGILDAMAKGLVTDKDVKLEIAGHTDSLGPQNYNLQLSQKRARAVKAYLESKGVDASRLKSEGYGEFNPVETNNTDAGRALNRRVEFKVLTTEIKLKPRG
jgi:OOP family OmpA-OmpF porin